METSIDQMVGRLEGKMDLMINNQGRIQESITALHKRVDCVEDRIERSENDHALFKKDVETDQKLFKRDVKWIAGIGLAFVAALKFIAGLFR